LESCENPGLSSHATQLSEGTMGIVGLSSEFESELWQLGVFLTRNKYSQHNNKLREKNGPDSELGQVERSDMFTPY
jgi:hypothetical protein